MLLIIFTKICNLHKTKVPKWLFQFLLFIIVVCFSVTANHNRTKSHARRERSVSIWNYFPLLPQNYHDDYLDLTDSTTHDVKLPEFRPLCQIVRRKVELEEEEYEFRPPYYVESICKSHTFDNHGLFSYKQACVYPGFRCVQRTQTIFLTRRRFNSDCWETFSQVIASSCDCMWPVASLGEIGHHF